MYIDTRTSVRYNKGRFATNEGHLLNRPISIYPGIGGVVYNGTWRMHQRCTWRLNAGIYTYRQVSRTEAEKMCIRDSKDKLPNITPHSFRHTYCTNMANRGMNPNTLQYLMGHANITMTLGYYAHGTFQLSLIHI